MKIKNLTAVLLSSLIIASAMPITSASALGFKKPAQKRTVVGISNYQIPENLCDNSLHNFVSGVSFDIKYSDGKTETFTLTDENVKSDLFDETRVIDYGYIENSFSGSVKDELWLSIIVDDYVSDKAKIHFIIADVLNGGFYESDQEYIYPDTYEVGKFFSKDGIVYSVNDDDTLTVDGYEYYTNDIDINECLNEDFEGTYYACKANNYAVEVTVPESVYGKTVTSVGSQAFVLNDENTRIKSVTLPETVKQINEYGVGYEYRPYDLKIDYALEKILEKAENDETFNALVYLYDDNADYIMDKYLTENDNYTYFESTDNNYAFLKGNFTKAELENIKKENTGVELNSVDSDIVYDETLVKLASHDKDNAGSTDVIIYLCKDSKFKLLSLLTPYRTIAKNVMNKCFPKGWSYTFDKDNQCIYTTANSKQISTLNSGTVNNVMYVLNNFNKGCLSDKLASELYFAEDDYKFDLLVFADGSREFFVDEGTVVHTSIDEFMENNFSDREDVEFFEINGMNYAVIRNVTKADISAIENSDINQNVVLDYISGNPIKKSDNFTIYGKNGSFAENYAQENGIEFSAVK